MTTGEARTQALIAECERQAENCQYTGASLYIWQKHARRWRTVFLVVPVILSGFATSQIFGQYLGVAGQIFAAVSGLLAGFFPAIFVSLNMDMKVAEIARAGAEFTNLRDRFRQAATIKSHAEDEEFETAFEILMDRMDAVRGNAPPVPDWCFREAQKKIHAGDYAYDRDEKS